MGCCSSINEGHEGKPLAFETYKDKYRSIEEVQEALRQAGLESSNLIIGIDYTKSNTYNGRLTFGNKSLHEIVPGSLNPYQEAIMIIGKTLEPFDDDKLIPVFGFGDSSTSDKRVFPFYPDRVCYGFAEVLDKYNEVTPLLILSGPTNFAPVIYEAVNITKESRAYHILIIIADGQVTNVNETIKAIVDASNYPLSIITIGVGDGPWEQMEEFDDGLPKRKFDNFQFVNFHKVMQTAQNREVEFARAALMEIPQQFQYIKKARLLG